MRGELVQVALCMLLLLLFPIFETRLVLNSGLLGTLLLTLLGLVPLVRHFQFAHRVQDMVTTYCRVACR